MILQSNPTLLREGESGGKGVTVIYCDGTEGHVDRWNIKKKKKWLKDIHSSPKTEALTNMLLRCFLLGFMVELQIVNCLITFSSLSY